MSVLYRGTCIYDDDQIQVRRSRVEPKEGVRVYRKFGAGNRQSKEYNNAKAARWRAAHREELRVYNREYMRKWRKRRAGAAFE